MRTIEANTPTVLRWTADADLRRAWADDTPHPEWADALVADDGLGWQTALHPDDLQPYDEALRTIAATHAHLVIEYRVGWAPEREVHLREELIGHPSGDVTVSGTAIDVTDMTVALQAALDRAAETIAFDELAQRLARRSAIEDLVAALAEHSDELLGTLNIAVLLASDDRRDLFVYQGPNPASGTTALQVVEFTGDTPAGLAAVSGREAFYTGPDDIAAKFPKLAQRIGDDRILGAAALPLNDGGESLGAIWFRWPTEVEFGPRLVELLQRTTAIFTRANVRQRERSEQERRLNDLAQTNRELESLSAVAAHDLKAPLRRVHSFVQLLEGELEPGAVSDDALRYAEVIRSQVDDMDRLVEDLLMYSAASRPDIEHEPVELSDVVSDVRMTLQPTISTHGARFELGKLPRVRGDRGLMVQLFANLVENAVKYRHPDRAPVVAISATRHSDDERHPQWHVTVADNGAGIAPELHSKVFQMFERGDVDLNEGTGIGLAIVKRITERHLGRVWLESEPGVGSTFHLILPGIPTIQTV